MRLSLSVSRHRPHRLFTSGALRRPKRVSSTGDGKSTPAACMFRQYEGRDAVGAQGMPAAGYLRGSMHHGGRAFRSRRRLISRATQRASPILLLHIAFWRGPGIHGSSESECALERQQQVVNVIFTLRQIPLNAPLPFIPLAIFLPIGEPENSILKWRRFRSSSGLETSIPPTNLKKRATEIPCLFPLPGWLGVSKP